MHTEIEEIKPCPECKSLNTKIIKSPIGKIPCIKCFDCGEIVRMNNAQAGGN